MEAFSVAMTNRALRTIKAELDFLADTSAITPAQLRTILAQLPTETSVAPTPAFNTLSLAEQTPSPAPTPANEKAHGYYTAPAHHNPPPAYPVAPAPPAAPPLAHAVALYAYSGADAGDLPLQPNDRVVVTEYMNAEWWKGRNERSGMEGIFPRTYVRVEEKAQGSGYGNMPLEVSQGGGQAAEGDGKAGKGAEMGKKIGKKLGNAAIFGAGATIGSNIVNSVF
ncbi:SH3-domain-containing protein [Trichodelitschia bisporula]|uniref:SH3-domain-containing protein n=1 Tax=Trichodelitschia bisporula TaxID=703511 RepID=A0A6G1HVX5_9PEZI|nr:SH3-domain-containing protein [Trichodelitschia bisporula]